MTDTQKLVLIDGVFTGEEAKDILINIFTSKISFHQLRNFSSQERFGKDDETAQKRIPALKAEMELLQQILRDAKEKQQKLIINAEVLITFLDE